MYCVKCNENHTSEYSCDQWGRILDIEFYHNVYKDHFGVRPRHLDLDAMTDEELRAEITSLLKLRRKSE